MGFSVSIDDSAERIIKRLKSNPASIFDHPYKGYLLFLAGASDQDILEWLEKNAIALDSLTGEEIAYIIFAKKFKFRLHCHSIFKNSRPPTQIGTMDPDEVNDGYDINRLVKSGRYGMVVDGDELAAITYAVDDIARQLGITDELPCIVILEAIPQDKVEVFRLSDEILQVLIHLLRQTLGRFQNMKGYDEIDKALETFVTLQNQLDKLEKQVDNLKQQIQTSEIKIAQQKLKQEQTVNSDIFQTQIIEKIKNAEEELRSGSVKRFRRKLKQIPGIEKEIALKIISFADFHKEEFFSLNRTIYSMSFCLNDFNWPLDVGSLERYKYIYNYARTLLKDLPSQPDPNAPEQCSAIINELEKRKESILNIIIDGIPQPKILVQQAIKNAQERLILKQSDHERRIDILRNKKKEIDAKIEETNVELNKAVNIYASRKLPSFSKIFKKTAKEYKISLHSKNAQNAVATFSGNLFKPETLMKLWAAIAS